MKKKILDYIESKGAGVSFVQLERDIPNFKDITNNGVSLCMCYGDNPELVIWQGFSREGYEAISELVKEYKIHLKVTNLSLLCYFADGKILKYPIAKFDRYYKRTHWMPHLIYLGSGLSEKPKKRTRLSRNNSNKILKDIENHYSTDTTILTKGDRDNG